MPTAIAVTSPDLALPATDRQTPAAVVLPAPHLQPLGEALTQTAAVLEQHGRLVVLYSAACPPEHVRRLHTLRAVLESDRIAILPLPLPPLGVAVLARQLRQLSLCDFSPGVLACAVRLLAHYVHAGALLDSVTGLDRVEVDLRAHLKSWLPGAHLAVLAHPEPQLHHVPRHASGAGLPGPAFATRLAVARGRLTDGWVDGVLAPAWQVQGVYEVPLPAESARWWGTGKLIEFAAAIPDLPVLHQLVASVRRAQCRWCGQDVIGDRCAFCAAPLTTAGTGTGGAERRPVGRPAVPGGAAGSAGAAGTSGPAAGVLPAVAPPSSLRQRGLSPVAPPGVRGAYGGPGGYGGYTGPDAPGSPGGPRAVARVR